MTPAVQTTGQGRTAAGWQCHQLLHQQLHRLAHSGSAFVLIICIMIEEAVPDAGQYLIKGHGHIGLQRPLALRRDHAGPVCAGTACQMYGQVVLPSPRQHEAGVGAAQHQVRAGGFDFVCRVLGM